MLFIHCICYRLKGICKSKGAKWKQEKVKESNQDRMQNSKCALWETEQEGSIAQTVHGELRATFGINTVYWVIFIKNFPPHSDTLQPTRPYLPIGSLPGPSIIKLSEPLKRKCLPISYLFPLQLYRMKFLCYFKIIILKYDACCKTLFIKTEQLSPLCSQEWMKPSPHVCLVNKT